MTEKELVQKILDEELVPLEVFYQEIRDASDNHLLAYRAQALLRSPELGELGPEEYGPTAGRSMLAISMFLWLLRQVCREYKKMQQNGMDIMSFFVIPVPMRALVSLDFAETLRTAFETEEFEFPQVLCLELPEQAIYEKLDKLQAAVAGIRSAGVKVAANQVGGLNYPVARLVGLGIEYAILQNELAEVFLSDDFEMMPTVAMISYLKNIEMRVVVPNIERGNDQARTRLERAGCAAYAVTQTRGMSYKELLKQKEEDEN